MKAVPLFSSMEGLCRRREYTTFHCR